MVRFDSYIRNAFAKKEHVLAIFFYLKKKAYDTTCKHRIPSGLKIKNIVKSALKGSKPSLFVDDFALCIRAKSLPHAQRLMQLSVNSEQDWISNDGFKFSTSKTAVSYTHLTLPTRRTV